MIKNRTGEGLDVVVVGGGAAGFFAAIAAKEANPALEVMILEATQHVLSKVKISGGGRCNVTTSTWDVPDLMTHYPRSYRKVAANFYEFGPQQVAEWFKSKGMPLVTEADGRMFPKTNTSETIVEGLIAEARRLGIIIQTGSRVGSIERHDDEAPCRFLVHVDKRDEPFQANFVVLASGGAKGGYQLAASLGHTLVSPKPSLFTFCVADRWLNDLTGVSVPYVKVRLTVEGLKKPFIQDGPILITHWGLSGPCILKLSAWGARELYDTAYHAILSVDWFPEVHDEALRQALLTLKAEHPHKQWRNVPTELPQRLWEYFLHAADIDPEQEACTLKDKPINQLAHRLKHWEFNITGKGPFKEEFVTAGGVPLTELNVKTYESKRCEGVYVVGELLNMDGVTGGYNFQNAWTSGYLTGQAIGL